MFLYGITLCIFVYILGIIYFKVKYPFWSNQPVFHFHNIKYWINPPGIIEHKLPKINKFYDQYSIFKKVSQLTDLEKQDIVQLIQQNYLRSRSCNFIPTYENIFGYFKNIEDNSFFGYKYNTTYLQGTPHKKCVGVITGKPLLCYLDNQKLEVNYVDYLCVHKKHRKQKLAPKLIYSYYVTQRNATDNPIFLFKRESSNTMIVPLTVFNCYAFDISYRKHPKYNLITEITPDNIDFLYNSNININFKCFIVTKYENLKALLENNTIKIYSYVYKNRPLAYYFFRDTKTYYDGKKEVELFASINNTTNTKFIYGLLGCLSYVEKAFDTNLILIENIANNNILLEYLMKKYAPKYKTTNSYYFYNFAYLPIKSNNVCCIY